MRTIKLIPLLTLFGWFCGCEGSDSDKLIITLSDNGKAVPIIREEMFEVQLEGNPSTGYAWTQTGGNDQIAKQIGEFSFQQRGNSPGSGGVFVFTFEALQVGYTTLKFEYKRPYSTNEIVQQTFEVIIVVQEKVGN